jgi:hypothetical protein
MYTNEQKTRIKNSVYALPAKKRAKILQLVALVSEEPGDELEYDVMVSYMDDDMDKELDEALKQAQAGGFQFEEVEETREPLPNKLKIKDK